MSETTVILPKSPVAASTTNPKNLIIFSKPKVGKTSNLAQLKDSLILDFEEGSDFVEAYKIKVNSIKELKEIGETIKNESYPYKYIVIDTITELEKMCIPYAETLYSKTAPGKNWFNPGGGKELYGNILYMPNGAGYGPYRDAFMKVLDYVNTLADRIILLGHVKDSYLEKNGTQVDSLDLDLTGKLKRMTAAKSDAIGYLYRKGDTNILSFKTKDTVSCGARSSHLSNAEIVLSEKDENGNLITHWDRVFID